MSETNDTLTAKDLYEQGSKCCQQYSQLTMQVRTLAQHVMIAYAVGLGLFLARGEYISVSYPGLVVFGAGIILTVFGLVLCLLNLHHSNAFRAIRDQCLVPLEENRKANSPGPWQAHQHERRMGWLMSDLAWYSPFIALWTIGIVSSVLGIWPFIGKAISIKTALVILVLSLAVSCGIACYFWLKVPRLRRALKGLENLNDILSKVETDKVANVRASLDKNPKSPRPVPKHIQTHIAAILKEEQESKALKEIVELQALIAEEITTLTKIVENYAG